MRFLAILRSGVSVEIAAIQFVEALLKKSWQENELNLTLACDFVNDLLAAIGLDCNITPEQIESGGSYIWPMEQVQIYSFRYVEMDFKRLEEFLREMCYLIKLQNKIFIKDLKDLHKYEVESPVELLMQLIAVWCNVYKHLQKFEEMWSKKLFEEPLARINFHLLLGMHELRKIYRLDLHLLDSICNRLYWSALQGLFYKQTHEMVFSGLLEIVSKSFDLFFNNSSQTLNFFYEAFSVQINSLTPLKLYQVLRNMLLEEHGINKLNILLFFLVEPYMLEVYFTTLLAKKYKRYDKINAINIEKIQQEALKFLDTLQSKLISLDCFSRPFIEAILNLVFNTDYTTSVLACNLYITMMKRKFSEEMILKHIMDFYVDHLGSTAHLRIYVEALYKSFEYLLNFNNILEIITDNQNVEIRLLSAHILVIVFELKVEKKDPLAKQQVQHLLQILPETFENLHCQRTVGILLQLYNHIGIENLKKEVLDNFIHYSVGVFTYTDYTSEYPLLMNIFSVFHKCLVYNQEWQHLELISDHLVNKYHEMIKELKGMEANQEKSLTNDVLQRYNNLLKRFNIILKTKYDLIDNNYLAIIRHLSHFFIYKPPMESWITETKSLIDLYVLEIIISCIIRLLKQEENATSENYSFLQEAEELIEYLWLKLENLDELLKLPIVRIKTYFCCFLQLIKYLPSKLNNRLYHQLLQILVSVNFGNKLSNGSAANELQQMHPLQCLEYQRLMLKQFTELHKNEGVQINTNSVWKLCIYYGMFKHNFEAELKMLLITLANHRVKIFKHIISVLIYNLFNQRPALKKATIVSIIKRHKQLIDGDIKVESSQLLKIHVVLLVLQILEKALTVQRINMGHNRLESLKYLHIFIEDVDLNHFQAKHLLLEQVNKLRQHLLLAEEGKFLTDFTKLLAQL